MQGLALINGTQMITSIGAEAVERAESIARQADIIAALTLEVLKGTTKAFDSGEKIISILSICKAQKVCGTLLRSYIVSCV